MQGNSTPQSGCTQKVLSCIEVGFMSQTTLSSIMTWCMRTMEPWSQDTLMEDVGTGVAELLVARAVQVCHQVHHRVRCVQPDKDLPYTEDGEADPQQSPIDM